MRLKGFARQLDVVSIQRDCKHLMEAVLALTDAFESVHGIHVDNRVMINVMSACYRDIGPTHEVESYLLSAAHFGRPTDLSTADSNWSDHHKSKDAQTKGS